MPKRHTPVPPAAQDLTIEVDPLSALHTVPEDPEPPPADTGYPLSPVDKTNRRRPTTRALEKLAIAKHKRAHADVMAGIGDPVAAQFERIDAAKLEAQAQAALTVPDPHALVRGAGEVALRNYPNPDDRNIGLWCQDTLEHPTLIAAQASLERQRLLLDLGCTELAYDVAATIEPRDSLERMLAEQLAAVHHAALKLLGHSLHYTGKVALEYKTWQQGEIVETCRLTNAAARLMSVFQEGLATLARLRSGGKQIVVVQHVQVQDGGQAVIAGDMTTGGGGLSATGGLPNNEGTMPCTQPTSSPGTSTFKAPGEPPVVAPKPAKRRRASVPPSTANGAVACTGDTSPARPEATSMP